MLQSIATFLIFLLLVWYISLFFQLPYLQYSCLQALQHLLCDILLFRCHVQLYLVFDVQLSCLFGYQSSIGSLAYQFNLKLSLLHDCTSRRWHYIQTVYITTSAYRDRLYHAIPCILFVPTFYNLQQCDQNSRLAHWTSDIYSSIFNK